MKKLFSLALAIMLIPSIALGATYNTSIYGDIEPRNTNKTLSVLRQAGPGDTVYLTISSYGGRIYPFKAIRGALDGEKLVIRVQGKACSAAAFILMLTPHRKVPSGSLIIFHTGYAETPAGKIKFSVYSNQAWIRIAAYESLNIMRPYKSLFTEREWETLKRGDDVKISASRLNTVRFK
jgi:ATP-dependent protease ClpP protease subunit